MTNESFASVPVDVTDEIALRRFLQRVVEQVDIITGSRAADPYVKTSEVTDDTVSLDSLNSSVVDLTKAVEDNADDIAENVDDIAANTVITAETQYSILHLALGTSYNDFDHADWSSLKGKGQFSALGSAMTNPPFAVTAGTTYIVYIDSALTAGGGVTQRVMMEDTGVDLKVFYRTGNSWATAKTNGWTQL